MGLAASSGKTMYWEPGGYSIPLHIVGDLKSVTGDGHIVPGPKDQCEECGAAYAIVKVNELLQVVPAHPYVAFMDLYRVRKYSRNETSTELGRYRAFMLDRMIDVFQRKCDSDDDRWKDITLMDLKEMTLYICDNWQELGIYAHQPTYDLQKRGVQLATWFKSWRNCMAEDIWPLYMDRRCPPDTADDYAPNTFVKEWAGRDGRQQPPKPGGCTDMSKETTEEPRVLSRCETPVAEGVLMADASVADDLLGPRKFHNIICTAKLRYTMQFDMTESMLKACTDIVGLPLCGLWEKVEVGPDNFLSVETGLKLGEDYPLQVDHGKLDETNAQAKALYDKLVELTAVVNDTKEAISASSIH